MNNGIKLLVEDISSSPIDERQIMSNRNTFSQWIQAEIRNRGWTQSDLARAAKLNRAVISKLINGKCTPQPITLEAISSAFVLPIEATYRAAGLLSPTTECDETTEEAIYLLRNINDVRRKTTALHLLQALADEEANEQPSYYP